MKNTQTIKQCTKCKKYFPSSSEFFHKNRTMKDGFDSWCKECKKEYDKQLYQYKRYSITKEDYEKMLLDQKEKCLICGRNFSEILFPQNTHIDHDHKTGKIRGLLCNNCNVILGNAFDNPLILIRAIEYLQMNKENIDGI
ncbi:MAG: endonuclease VII domain-containing protein [Candidatus Hermodarchaeota archaeon]